MSGRNTQPKPTEPKPANKHRQQSKAENESIPAVNYRKTEKDVVKLIDCLAEWTWDLRAARSAAAAVPPRRGRSRSHIRRVSTVSLASFYPRGNALTESMEFTDRDGAVWLAYIESAAHPPPRDQDIAKALPDRHLRFDSATESRFTLHPPAGSPFLGEARLRSLLDQAQPDLPLEVTTGASARAYSSVRHRVLEWSAGAVESARETVASWARGWQQTASRREALRHQVREMLSGAANTLHGMVEVLLGRGTARPSS
jgi:hypothetical protein